MRHRRVVLAVSAVLVLMVTVVACGGDDGGGATSDGGVGDIALVDVSRLDDLNARQVLLRRYLVLTPAAYESLERRFAGNGAAQKES